MDFDLGASGIIASEALLLDEGVIELGTKK